MGQKNSSGREIQVAQAVVMIETTHEGCILAKDAETL